MMSKTDQQFLEAVHKWRAREEEEVHTLGSRIGFGNMMSLASKCWEKVIKTKNYPPGGEFVVGPCKAMTTTCVCIDEKQHSYGCDYCMGCGWLTPPVKRLILILDK